MKNTQVNTRVSDDLKAGLLEIAACRKRVLADIVRLALEREVRRFRRIRRLRGEK